MKKFIYKSILFILPFLVIFIFVEFSLRSINTGFEQKKTGLIAQADSIEILITGNSHAADGINPSVFIKPAYNIAFPAQSILYDKELVIKYLKILKKLRFVLISIDYTSLYWGVNNEREFFYHFYHDINLKNKSFHKEYLSYFFYVYTPRPASQIIFNRPDIVLENGWIGIDRTNYDDINEFAAKHRVLFFNSDINKSIESSEHILVCKELESLIIFLIKNNIEPVLITAPCHKLFCENLDDKIMQDITDFTNQLKDKYQISYLNSLTDSSFHESDFYDVDHLNKYGAVKYSKKLDSLIQRLDSINQN